ncbi:hypothetical protein CLOM_g17029 [Closterium sp. NIES-68]|nr:hypothetical protein CLOM_g17029 [Closterium sp. NIES-68]GJP80950.1 hypothetical protein CLOP_g11141 [Closterium sp. NIES-67]
MAARTTRRLALALLALVLSAAISLAVAQNDPAAPQDSSSSSAAGQPITSEAGPSTATTAPSEGNKVYIVRMRGVPPLAGYTGGISGYEATAPRTRAAQWAAAAGQRLRQRLPRINLRKGPAKAFAKMLGRMQEKVAKDINLPMKNVLYSYKFVSNGFAAKLSPDKVEQLKRHPDVADVFPSYTMHKLTTDSSEFLKLPDSLWAVNGGQSKAGEDVVVGIVDTGIWPEHPSFSDNTSIPFGPPPASWRGTCQTTDDFPACNNKLIGARHLSLGFREMTGDVEDLTYDWGSARDADGHGSWCAAAAAGNSDVDVFTTRDQLVGMASGMAPRARIAAYKVFWSNSNSGGMTAAWADVEAAVNFAVADGVDVLSLSLGGLDPDASYFDDMPYLFANLANVAVVYAAGNSGPPQTGSYMYRTLSNFSPFYLTVGASTIGRRYLTTITLGDGTEVQGSGFGAGGSEPDTAGIIEGIAARRSGITIGKSDQCLPYSLDQAKVVNKYVLCSYGGVPTTDKVADLMIKGARGILLLNIPHALEPFTPYDERLPVIYLPFLAADSLRTYARSTSSPTVTLSVDFEKNMDLAAPAMAYFSSTGPVANPYAAISASRPCNDILKPDITAPGVSLWSAWRGSTPGTDYGFAMISGTSMATPHMAGIVALIVQQHPNWTPAQIFSAIMTSATTTDTKDQKIQLSSGATATPWDMGAGHVNVGGVLDPGLTYNAGATDYYNFLAGQGLTKARALLSTRNRLVSVKPYMLNRPTIAVSRLSKSVSVTRTVTNVGSAASNYTVTVVPPQGVTVTVTPAKLSLAVGGSATFTVKFSVTQASWEFKYGTLMWKDAFGHVVKSTIAVQPIVKDTVSSARKKSIRRS